jgi:hypothetical protein
MIEETEVVAHTNKRSGFGPPNTLERPAMTVPPGRTAVARRRNRHPDAGGGPARLIEATPEGAAGCSPGRPTACPATCRRWATKAGGPAQ